MKLHCSATKLLSVSSYGFEALPMTHVFPRETVEVKSLQDISKATADYHLRVTQSGVAGALSFHVQKNGERAFNGMDKTVGWINRQLRYANPDLVRVNEN
jgi:hypothetical protein